MQLLTRRAGKQCKSHEQGLEVRLKTSSGEPVLHMWCASLVNGASPARAI